MSANTYLTPEERAVLESARVGIAGAGGLGSNCAMHLVRAGVKHLIVVDFDVVNESNLNRQFFFRDQLGQKKVEALKENLLRIDPDADIRAVDAKIDAASVKEIFAKLVPIAMILGVGLGFLGSMFTVHRHLKV